MKLLKYFVLIVMSVGSLAGYAEPLKLYSKSFPIGVYSADPATDENFAFLKSIGVDYVHTYGIGANTEENNIKTQKLLDLAQKHGLKVMFNLKCRVWVKKADGIKQLRQLVQKFKKHPALGFWYVYDEPLPNLLPKLKEIYRMLKQETPEIPVALVTPWIKDWYKLAEATDILMVDNYPVRDKSFPHSPINQIIDFTKSALKHKKMVIPVFQTINWKIFAHQLKGKGYDESKYRFPNWQEERFWAFSSLCLGVHGQFYYSFYNAKYRCKGEKWLKEVLGRVTKETREFTTLVAPAWRPNTSQYLKDQKLYVGTWRSKIRAFVIVANNSPEERYISVPLNGYFRQEKLMPWGDTRKIVTKISKGILTTNEKIKPWEVFIWQTK
jgi:hypothetical protein